MSNGTGADADAATDFRHYDTLPQNVRRFISEAPFNVSCITATSIRRKWGLDSHELLEELQDRMARYVQREIRETYGTGHPQYRREEHAGETD